MTAPLKILIADDHPLLRQGLRQAIEREPAYRVVHEAGDGRTAIQSIHELKPDVAILDVKMPEFDGFDVVRELRKRGLGTEVIILTMYKEEDMLNAALDLGIKGYVLKESAATDILDSIRSVVAGHRYISPGLSDVLVARRTSAASLRASRPALDQLTHSQRRILRLVAEDKTSKEIAEKLGLSLRTVENHRTNICAKLGVHGVHGLVKFAYENKALLDK